MKLILKSIRGLQKYLGYLDGIFQLNEIMLSHCRTSLSDELFEKIVRAGSSVIGIKVSYKEWPRYYARFYQELIVSVYSAFEKYYDDYREELLFLFPDKDIEFDLKENNKINRLMVNYKKAIGRDIVLDDIYIRIFNYYHNVRNMVVHVRRIDRQRVLDKYNLIDVKKAQKLFGTSPNTPAYLSFHDYIIFSKTTKKIAGEFCFGLNPTEENILRLLPDSIRAISKVERKKRAFREYYRREYGLKQEDIDILAKLVR